MHEWEEHQTVQDLAICKLCKMARYPISRVDTQYSMCNGIILPQSNTSLNMSTLWLNRDIARFRRESLFGCVYLYSGLGYYEIKEDKAIGNWYPGHDPCYPRDARNPSYVAEALPSEDFEDDLLPSEDFEDDRTVEYPDGIF